MKENSYGRAALYGAAGYGGGLALGIGILALLLRIRPILIILELIPSNQYFIELLIGLILGLLMFGGVGAIGGGIGGWALTHTETIASPRRFINRSALSFGLTYALLVLPLIFLSALVAFYSHPSHQRSSPILILFTFYGFLLGLVAGLFLALFTSKLRYAWRVWLGSILGFTLGGLLLGQIMYWHQADNLFSWLPEQVVVVLAILLFGAAGGAALGLAYHWLAGHEATRGERLVALPRWLRITRLVALVLIISLVGFVTWRLLETIRIRDAHLQTIIPVGAQGTHWTEPLLVADGTQPSIFASGSGTPFVAWAQGGDIFYSSPANVAPVNISNSPSAHSTAPSGAADSMGNVHLVWQADEGILYGRCQNNVCTSPQLLVAECGGGAASQPTLTIDDQDMLVTVWRQGSTVAFAAWSAGETPGSAASGCIITGEDPQNLAVAAVGDGRYLLTFDDSGAVLTSEMNGSGWSPPIEIGQGHSPTVYANNGTFLAWCSTEGQVMVQEAQGNPEIIPFPGCNGRPALTQDNEGHLHVLWYSHDVVKATGNTVSDQSLIYESVRQNGEWLEAAIVSHTKTEAELDVTAVFDGVLHMAWADQANIQYASQTAYDCTEPDLNDIETKVYEALNQTKFKPANEQLPVCGNRYDGIFYTPNPNPIFSDQVPTPNGAYDQVADLVEMAQYEVLFGTMQWDETTAVPSPGTVFAEAVVNLYNQVKANPEQYPKGMTVRILTGNMPEMAMFELGDHTWHVLKDLHAAGLPKLVDEEIGWQVEIADFDGSWPHLHTKIMIVDGKSVMAAGYNYSYLHLPQNHPSGLGVGMIDFGMHMTGPVAQAMRAAYDDLWDGSDTLECDEMVSQIENLWELSCERGTAVVDHIPEVLKYYVPEEGSANAYAMFRTHHHLAGDEAIEAAIRATNEKIDIFEVNFSLEIYCDAAIVFHGICNYDQNALPFMVALMETIEAKRVPVRILVEKEAMNGAENKVAIQAFVDELEERGLRDLVQIRFYEGKMHSKAVNIDNQFLIIGSQNFHYSAWGENGLAEFSLGTDDPQAIEDFQGAFEFRWADAIPAEEEMPSLAQ